MQDDVVRRNGCSRQTGKEQSVKQRGEEEMDSVLP